MISVVVSDGKLDTLMTLSKDDSVRITDFSDSIIKAEIVKNYESYFSKLLKTMPGLKPDILKDVKIIPICIIDSVNLDCRFIKYVSISVIDVLNDVIERSCNEKV